MSKPTRQSLIGGERAIKTSGRHADRRIAAANAEAARHGFTTVSAPQFHITCYNSDDWAFVPLIDSPIGIDELPANTHAHRMRDFIIRHISRIMRSGKDRFRRSLDSIEYCCCINALRSAAQELGYAIYVTKRNLEFVRSDIVPNMDVYKHPKPPNESKKSA